MRKHWPLNAKQKDYMINKAFELAERSIFDSGLDKRINYANMHEKINLFGSGFQELLK